MELPPLPAPAMVINAKQHNPSLMWDAYTAAQMREYAEACVRAWIASQKPLDTLRVT